LRNKENLLRRTLFVVALSAVAALVLTMFAATAPAAAPSSAERRCHNLIRLSRPDTTVTAATVDASGSFTVPEGQGGIGEASPGDVLPDLPAFCEVSLLRTNPPAHDHVHIEVWLPLSTWNGRFDGVGGGGFVAGISFRALAAALRSGYAAASTDTGHPAAQQDGSFALAAAGALDEPAITDFADRAVHEMTVAGQAVTARFYSAPAEYSYFTGCSQGGRQALTEAERYPADYDGILAGAPAVNFAHLSPAQLWPVFVEQQAGDYLPKCKFAAFQSAVVARCDRLDGVVDGIVGNVAACRFDPRSLIGTRTPCGVITRTDTEVMARIWQGPRTTGGRFLWYGIEPTADASMLAQNPWYVGTSWLQYWVNRDPDFDWTAMSSADFTRDFEQGVREFGPLVDNSADLSRFRAAGGKLVLWTGLSDQFIPSQDTIAYWDTMTRRSREPDSFARLFLAPGVGHCGTVGNSGPVPADPLGALTSWVENADAPESIRATTVVDHRVVRSRPLCRYPLVARYTGHGSTDDAANFRCARGFRP
jgi:feruloyl esterase